MRIVYISEFFSENMGYSENCLPKAMANLGNEVHVITSDLQVYGNLPSYENTYGKFLGQRIQPCGSKSFNAYTLHRLPHKAFFGYVDIYGLLGKIAEIRPDVVHSINCVSTNTFKIAMAKIRLRYKMFTECHQHLSVVQPYLFNKNPLHPRRLTYFLTRTLLGAFISLCSEKCFPIAPDCAEVAHRFYGVQKRKIRVMSLGTDTELFVPARDELAKKGRNDIRRKLGINPNEIVCIYTGRFSHDKNPLILSKAISRLIGDGLPFRALFIGDGPQKGDLESCIGSVVIPFVSYRELPEYYRAADIGVWPMQESTSMLDAAACGLPIVVSDQMGDQNRVEGNGRVYHEGDIEDIVKVLRDLSSENLRIVLGKHSRLKMVEEYSWLKVAKEFLEVYQSVLTN